MEPVKIYEYLVKARGQVLESVRMLSEEQYRREWGFGLKTIASTITHIMISEWFYIERLQGRSIPPYSEWPIQYEKPPAFEVVDSTWRRQAPRVHAAIAAEREWRRPISYTTLPDDEGKRFRVTVTAGDIVTQLVLHETHHRAQALAMLRMLGSGAVPIEDIDYNVLMYDRQPA